MITWKTFWNMVSYNPFQKLQDAEKKGIGHVVPFKGHYSIPHSFLDIDKIPLHICRAQSNPMIIVYLIFGPDYMSGL
jgi:hypothetical protein